MVVEDVQCYFEFDLVLLLVSQQVLDVADDLLEGGAVFQLLEFSRVLFEFVPVLLIFDFGLFIGWGASLPVDVVIFFHAIARIWTFCDFDRILPVLWRWSVDFLAEGK